MYCPECGTKNEDGARFCAECGTRLDDIMDEISRGTGNSADSENESGVEQESGSAMGGMPGPEVGYTDPNLGGASGPDAGYAGSNMGNAFGPDAGYAGPDKGGTFGSEMGYTGPGMGSAPGPDMGPGSAASQMGYQKYSQPRQAQRVKKPVSKAVVALAVELVLAAAVVAGIVYGGGKKYDPEATAMAYWKSVMAHEWSDAYEYCLFPQSEMLTKQMYVNANSNASAGEIINYTSARAIESGEMVDSAAEQLGGLAELFGADADALADKVKSGINDSDVKNYVVEYLEEGTSQKQYSYVALTRTGKKQFFFWDEWKVASSDVWVKDAVFTIPEGSQMSLNGVPVDSSAATVEDGQLQIRIPYMFVGTYQLTVSAEGMEPYRKLVEVTGYGPDLGYIGLVPSEENLAALGEQAGADVCRIINSALAGKDFSEVQGLFGQAVLADGTMAWAYQELREYLTDAEIVELKISDVAAVPEETPSEVRVDLALSAGRSETKPSYGGGLETITDPLSMYATYVKEDGSWKLVDFPVNMRDF